MAYWTAFFLLGLTVLGLLFGLNPARLASRVASASGVGRMRGDAAGDWTKGADEAIARALQPPPPPSPLPNPAAPLPPSARSAGAPRGAER